MLLCLMKSSRPLSLFHMGLQIGIHQAQKIKWRISNALFSKKNESSKGQFFDHHEWMDIEPVIQNQARRVAKQ